MREKNERENENLQEGGVRQIMGVRELTDDWALRRYEDARQRNKQYEKQITRRTGRSVVRNTYFVSCESNQCQGERSKIIDRNGWRFYSESYINEIVDFMENLIIEEIPTYREFLRDMNLSEEEIQAFRK